MYQMAPKNVFFKASLRKGFNKGYFLIEFRGTPNFVEDPRITYHRMRRNQFVYIIFQASSGREMDQNKGLWLLLYSILFGSE